MRGGSDRGAFEVEGSGSAVRVRDVGDGAALAGVGDTLLDRGGALLRGEAAPLVATLDVGVGADCSGTEVRLLRTIRCSASGVRLVESWT